MCLANVSSNIESSRFSRTFANDELVFLRCQSLDDIEGLHGAAARELSEVTGSWGIPLTNYAQLAQADGRPVLETFNVVERLAAEEYQLVVAKVRLKRELSMFELTVGLGTYQLRDRYSLLHHHPIPQRHHAASEPSRHYAKTSVGRIQDLPGLSGAKDGCPAKAVAYDTPTSELSQPSSHGRVRRSE